MKFPTTTEKVPGHYAYLTKYENLDELNHLACLLSEPDQGDLEKLEAVIDSGEHTSGVADLINLAQNPDYYEFSPDIESEEALSRYYLLYRRFGHPRQAQGFRFSAALGVGAGGGTFGRFAGGAFFMKRWDTAMLDEVHNLNCKENLQLLCGIYFHRPLHMLAAGQFVRKKQK